LGRGWRYSDLAGDLRLSLAHALAGTGTALAVVSADSGLKSAAVFSDAFSHAKHQAMEAFGATVLVEPSNGGGITHELAERMKARAHALAEQPGHYYADQFDSPDVRRGYRPMGREMVAALDGDIDVFCAAVGAGGAMMGTVDGMREMEISPRLVALEPSESPLQTTGRSGAHKVAGIAVFPDPPFRDRSEVSEIRTVDQDRAFEICRKVAR
jgi:cysteine synthase A